MLQFAVDIEHPDVDLTLSKDVLARLSTKEAQVYQAFADAFAGQIPNPVTAKTLAAHTGLGVNAFVNHMRSLRDKGLLDFVEPYPG